MSKFLFLTLFLNLISLLIIVVRYIFIWSLNTFLIWLVSQVYILQLFFIQNFHVSLLQNRPRCYIFISIILVKISLLLIIHLFLFYKDSWCTLIYWAIIDWVNKIVSKMLIILIKSIIRSVNSLLIGSILISKNILNVIISLTNMTMNYKLGVIIQQSIRIVTWDRLVFFMKNLVRGKHLLSVIKLAYSSFSFVG